LKITLWIAFEASVVGATLPMSLEFLSERVPVSQIHGG
jgi:hypothetical protein